MLTIDASVFINAANSKEAGSPVSLAFLKFTKERSLPIYSPTLLLVEVASSLSRVFRDPGKGIQMIQEIRVLTGQTWVSLDNLLADEAAALGAAQGLRGADAVYAAVALRHKTTLITLDQQQFERLAGILPVSRPGEILKELS